MNTNTEIITAQAVSIDPNDIFQQFGLNTPDTRQNVTQRVGNIRVEPAYSETEYAEVEPEGLVYIETGESLAPINGEGLIPIQVQSIDDLLIDSNQDYSNEISTSVEEFSEETISDVPFISSLIPVNKESYKIKDNTSRFSGATWFNAIQESTITLAGIGGIGSFALFMLSRMQPKQIFIYDDDRVEMANLSGQLYSKKMIGEFKVDAMAKMIKDFSDYHATMASRSRFDSDSNPTDIMICGFDNMEARKTFFEVWNKHASKSEHPEKCLFIDARLAAEEFQVFCMTGTDKYYIKKYVAEYLFRDRDAEHTLCSYKQTSYCANMIGSIMINLFVNFIANTLNPVIKRDLPFKTYYDASLMFFKTES